MGKDRHLDKYYLLIMRNKNILHLRKDNLTTN